MARTICFSVVLFVFVFYGSGCEDPVPAELHGAQLRFQKLSEKVKRKLLDTFDDRKLEMLEYSAGSKYQTDETLVDTVPLTGLVTVKYRGVGMDTDKFNRLIFNYDFYKSSDQWIGRDFEVERTIYSGLDDGDEAFRAIVGFQPTMDDNEEE